MKQAIRALGWAINILWIILILFAATVVYSAFQIRAWLDPPYTNALGNTLIVSLPFHFTNSGLYDISNLAFGTLIQDSNGVTMSNSTTVEPFIPKGVQADLVHNVSFSLTDMMSQGFSNLLFNDTQLDIDLSVRFVYARVLPLEISTNMTMPWGAPLYNLALGSFTVNPYNATHFRVTLPISFENHSFFGFSGNIRLELVDNGNRLLGSGNANLVGVSPQAPYSSVLDVLVSNPINIRTARLFFDTSAFSYGPVVIPLV